MVRKIVSIIALALTVCALGAPLASAYSVYDDGNISTTYTAIFKEIIPKIDPSDDYVFFRSGQYDYSMIVGELIYDGGVFAAVEPVDVYQLSYSQSGYNSSVYDYSVFTDNNFSLNTGGNLVYSNLGDYPILNERGDIYEFISVVLLSVIGLCLIFRSIFSFCIRNR